ncbi:MAG: GntR family transcriptional regulator [Nocardiopsaceae bacterium]|nr:GntR family transcriptional regulator [Nocardiopsaceae bacterium]
MSGTTDGRSWQVRIADDIRARIESGAYPEGSRIPTLPEIRDSYPGKPSLVTVREAIRRLRQEGLIVSKQGSGNFVRERPPVRRFGLARYSRSVWAGEQPQRLLDAEGARQGRAVEQATETAQVRAPAFAAERLGIAEGELVNVRQRITRIDGTINQGVDSYFTIATGERNPDLLTGRGAGGHIARINAVSPVQEIQEEITARMPTGPESSRLEIPEGTPVLDVIRTYHTAEGPLDVARFIIRADMATFDYRFPVPD